MTREGGPGGLRGRVRDAPHRARAGDPERLDALRAWAQGHGLTFHHIVLDGGLIPPQPMVTRRGRGDLAGGLAAAADLAARLAAGGYAVTRVKVEAAPVAFPDRRPKGE